MKLWKLLLIYAIVAIVAYAVIYYVFLIPAPAPTSTGSECVPGYYQQCP